MTVHDEHGRPRRSIGSISDIHQRKLKELELVQTRQLLQDAIDSIDGGLVMFDADDRLVFCNQRYRDIYGFAPHEIETGTYLSNITRAFYTRHPGVPARHDARPEGVAAPRPSSRSTDLVGDAAGRPLVPGQRSHPRRWRDDQPARRHHGAEGGHRRARGASRAARDSGARVERRPVGDWDIEGNRFYASPV